MRIAATVASFAVCGCATSLPALQQHRSLTTIVGAFEIEYAQPNASDEATIETAIQHAAPKLVRWGKLRDPVRVFVLANHEQLEKAVNRVGYPWLEGWARYDEIFMQSPHTWSLLGPTQLEVDERMLHELTHCLMYQQIAQRSDWQRKGTPLWFREGMASYTAGEAYRRPSLEDLAQYLAEHPNQDPILADEQTYRRESQIVYGAGLHAFTFLVKRYGEDTIPALFQRMRDGASFSEAFESGIGIPADAFINDFRRYLKWRGFQKGRPIALSLSFTSPPS
jgi:hypothetical protein